jgi:nucleoside 2-deoxyribosyltransferase
MSVTQTTTPRLFCFVLMPFDETFADVYKIGIRESCEAAGAYCERVDEQIFNERILDRIYNQIAKADLIIADMTGRNPNVFYEVGYAHALGKTTILLTSKTDDIPFDLKHFSHIVYGNSLSELRTQLTKRVKWVVENPPKDGVIMLKEDVEVFVGNKNLTNGTTLYEYSASQYPNIEICLHNISSRIIDPGFLKIGFITTKEFSRVRTENVQTIQLPDGRLLHLLPDLPALLPDEYAKALLVFHITKTFMSGVDVDIVLRLFTARGSQDFNIIIRPQKKV